MADQEPNTISRPGGAPGGKSSEGLLEKFQALPRQAQIAVVVGGVVVLMWMFGGGGGGSAPSGSATMGVGGGISPTEPAFKEMEVDRSAIMQSVQEQNRRELTQMRDNFENMLKQRDELFQSSIAEMGEMKREMSQMMGDIKAEVETMQAGYRKNQESINQLSSQQREMELNAATDGTSGASPVASRRPRISTVPISGGGGPRSGRALQVGAPFSGGPLPTGDGAGIGGQGPQQGGNGARLPFVPPLGFVRAQLINGVDAPVGGQAAPVLARIQGVYKTAMNSTVSLDGCLVQLQFSGNISTERAMGKPTNMTCVYPDGGAATYTLQGYVVDAEDGIVGVPGVLYEGDPARMASAMAADFVAGIGALIESNQNTNTVDSAGTTKSTLTGDQTKAAVAGGVNKMMGSFSQYMQERVNRVQPFIRLDATREVHLVLLNGTELRAEGGGWTNMFESGAADQSRAQGLPATPEEASGGRVSGGSGR